MAAHATPIAESVLSAVAARIASMLKRDEVMTREVADLLRIPTSTCTSSRGGAISPHAGLDVRGDPCGRVWRSCSAARPRVRSGGGREDVGRRVVGDVAVRPRNPQLAIALEKPLQVDESHLDRIPILVELDAVALGTRVCMRAPGHLPCSRQRSGREHPRARRSRAARNR